MNKKTILIVADQEHTRKPLFDLFSMEGYTVLTASSGQEGLEMLIKERPSLSIIDQALPITDGFETLRRFKKISPETPVIMLSGHGTIATAVKAMKMGAFDYLVKPPTYAEILDVVNRAISDTKLE